MSAGSGQPTTRVRRGMAFTLIILGGAMLGAAWFSAVEGWDFLSGLLVEVGVTLFLLVPLLLISRRLEWRVVHAEAESRRQVDSLRERVDEAEAALVRTAADLSEAMTNRARGARAELDQLFEAVVDDPSRETLLRALNEARRRGFISQQGVRVAFPNTDLSLRFAAIGDWLRLTLERLGGEPVVSHLWAHSQTPLQAFAGLTDKLRAAGEYPGDAAVIPGECYEELRRLLLAASEAEARGRTEIRKLIQLFGEQWALSEDQIVSLDQDYTISRSRLAETDWRQQLRGQGWVDLESLDAAILAAAKMASGR